MRSAVRKDCYRSWNICASCARLCVVGPESPEALPLSFAGLCVLPVAAFWERCPASYRCACWCGCSQRQSVYVYYRYIDCWPGLPVWSELWSAWVTKVSLIGHTLGKGTLIFTNLNSHALLGHKNKGCLFLLSKLWPQNLHQPYSYLPIFT